MREVALAGGEEGTASAATLVSLFMLSILQCELSLLPIELSAALFCLPSITCPKLRIGC